MYYHALPKELVGPGISLRSGLIACGLTHGKSHSVAEALYRRLPQDFADCVAFFDRHSRRWRYDYGEPLEIPGSSQVLLGIHQFPELEHLFLALTKLELALTQKDFEHYLDRLSNRSKHQAVLFEARPLLWLSADVPAAFEVVGRGIGNRTIDWLFTPPIGQSVLVEVKYRLRDLVDHFQPLAHSNDEETSTDWARPGRPDALFRSTWEKYQETSPDDQLQGAWIHAHVKVRRQALHNHFLGLPADRLHFFVLSTWEKKAYLAARPGIDKEALRSMFGIDPSEDFVV